MEDNSSNKRIAKNTIIMYGRMLIMLVVSLYTSRVVFNALGVDDYGIYNVVGGIIVFFTFINNGLSRATSRYITAELATGDEESQSNIFNLALVAHVIISALILLLGETVGLWLVNSYLNIPEGRMGAANFVYQFSLLTSIVGVMQTPFQSVIIAHEKMSIYAYMSIVEALLKLATALLLVSYIGDKLSIYALLLLLVALTNGSIYCIYCMKKYTMCLLKRPHGRTLLKEMFNFMSLSLFGSFAVVLTNQGVNILINIFYTVAVNAAMGISTQITSVVTNFVYNFQLAFNPQITKQFVKRDFDSLVKLTLRSSRYTSYLVLVFLVPMLFESDNLLTIWLGDYPQYAVEFCQLTLIGIYFDAISGPLWMISGANNDIKKYQITVSSIFVLNLLFSWIFLLMGFEPYIVLIIRACIYLVLTMVRLCLAKELVPNLSIKEWAKDVLLSSLIIFFLASSLMWSLELIHFNNMFVHFFINASSGVVITVLLIVILGLKNGERIFVKEKIKNIIKI